MRLNQRSIFGKKITYRDYIIKLCNYNRITKKQVI